MKIFQQSERIATLTFCSALGAPENMKAKPFEANKWHALRLRVLSCLGGVGELLSASESQLSRYFRPDDIERLLELRKKRNLNDALNFLSDVYGIDVICDCEVSEHRYWAFKSPVMFALGNKDLLDLTPDRSIAIVGARNASQEHLELAAMVARSAAKMKYIVVSGGARGVDSEASFAALDSGGASILVLPYGLATSQTRQIAEQLKGRYLLLSRFAPFAPFNSWRAVARNSDIYCLAKSAVVIGAKEGSGGSWSGAVQAIKENMTSIFVFESQERGELALIRKGARQIKKNEEDIYQIFSAEKGSLL